MRLARAKFLVEEGEDSIVVTKLMVQCDDLCLTENVSIAHAHIAHSVGIANVTQGVQIADATS